MNNSKMKFITLLIIESGLIALHLALTEPRTTENSWAVFYEWHFWLGLLFGYFVIFYMFTLACSKCGSKQIWRSHNIIDWRLPESKCWNCGDDIEKQ